MGGPSKGHKGGVLGAVPLERKTPGFLVFGLCGSVFSLVVGFLYSWVPVVPFAGFSFVVLLFFSFLF